jgi:hypothetical protein
LSVPLKVNLIGPRASGVYTASTASQFVAGFVFANVIVCTIAPLQNTDWTVRVKIAKMAAYNTCLQVTFILVQILFVVSQEFVALRNLLFI